MGLTVYGGGGKPEEEKTVTAGTSAIVVNPSSGKVMKKVTVNPTPTEEKTVTAGTSATTVTPTSGKYIKKVTVNPTPSQSKTVTPSTSQQTVSPDSGKLLSRVIVNGDSDLVADNIRKNINIFGVLGTLVEGVAGIDSGEVTLASEATSITINHSLGVSPTEVYLIPTSPRLPSYAKTIMVINDKVLFGKKFDSWSWNSCTQTKNVDSVTFNCYQSDSYSNESFHALTYKWFVLA